MSDCDAIAPLIPWYAGSGLDESDRRRVEEHLTGCADCRALLVMARDAGEAFDTIGEEGLTAHVEAQLLAEFAEDPDALEADAERWVRSHLAACAACEDALGAVRASLAEEAPRPEPLPLPGRSPLARLWEILGASVLRPAPALAYLVVLVALAVPLVLQRGETTDPGALDAVTLPQVLTLRGERAFRGEQGDEAVLQIPGGAGASGPVVLRLLPDLLAEDRDDPEAAFEIQIALDDAPVWKALRGGADFGPEGGLTLLLEPGRLEAGRVHELRIVFRKDSDPLDGRVLFRRSFIPTG